MSDTRAVVFHKLRDCHGKIPNHKKDKAFAIPPASINIQTEFVNGERGHYLVWSVRVKG